MWNTDWKNRMGWGTDSGTRGRDADNFKLNGLGWKWDRDLNTNSKGLFENDENTTDIENCNGDEKERCDNGTFDKWLLT